MKRSAQFFFAIIVGAGLAVLLSAPFHSDGLSAQWVRSATFFVIAVIAARLRVKLPGITGSMSVNLPFILLALTQLRLFEVLVIACASCAVQCFWTGRRVEAAKLAFNICNMANAVGVAHFIYNAPVAHTAVGAKIVLLALATAGYFFVNSAPVAVIIGLTESKSAAKVWSEVFFLTYPYYLLSAALTGSAIAMGSSSAWQVPLVVLILVYGVYSSYKRYFASHVETKTSLAMKTAVGA